MQGEEMSVIERDECSQEVEIIHNRISRISENIKPKKDVAEIDYYPSVCRTIALGYSWRGLVSDVSSCDEFDFRGNRTVYLHYLKETLVLIKEVLKLASSQGTDSLDDLKLVIHETENIARWVERWPLESSEQRDAARREFAKGNHRSVSEFTNS